MPIARNGEKTWGTRDLAAGASGGPTLRRLEVKGTVVVSGIGEKEDGCEQTLIGEENLGTKDESRCGSRIYLDLRLCVRSSGTPRAR